MSTFRHRHPRRLRWYGAAFMLMLTSALVMIQQSAISNTPSARPTLHAVSDLSKLPIAFIPNEVKPPRVFAIWHIRAARLSYYYNQR